MLNYKNVFGARTLLFGFSALIASGFGCGGGGGCGGLAALPKDPGPWGFPMDQAIEGGMQARITKSGFTKISALIPAIAASALPTVANPACLPQQNENIEVAGTGAEVQLCYTGCGNNGAIGCPVTTALRPDLAPPGGISVSMQDNTTQAIVDLDAAFDVHIVIPTQWRFCIFGLCAGWNHICDLHVDAPGTHIKGAIDLSIDPPTGKLVPSIGNLTLPGLDLQTSNCGLASDLFNGVFGIINAIAGSFLGNLVIGLIQPQLTTLVQGLLPNPPGLTGSINMGKTLAAENAPADANLEMLLVAGGYVSALNGGLNLGVISGMNSDRDQTTRTPGLTSEPSLCVPIRPAPALSAAPWNLPIQPMRLDHMLAPAGPFAGNPDPTNMKGDMQDLAIGISRGFLNLAGFHIYNSGTMCLAISGGVLSAFNAGAISVLVPSLGNILDNRKAPVAVVLRPQTPLTFTVGAGTVNDALLHIAVNDLRVDFYVFIDERYVRAFTLGLDLNVGINLTVGVDMNMKPTITPMLSGIDTAHVTARVTNTDLLSEDPKKIATGLLSLIGVAVGQIAGTLPSIALPNLMGFSLDNLQITRVSTAQDDFLAIFGDLSQDPMMMMYPLPESTVPYRRGPQPVETRSELSDVSVPPPDVIYDSVMAGDLRPGNVPSVTLKLGSTSPRPEWTYRIDGGAWHTWSSDPNPTISDVAFQLQAKHTIDVRSRTQGDWLSEDPTPEQLNVTIDSLSPELHLAVKNHTIDFGGWDNVSDTSAIRYAWKTPNGETSFSSVDHLSFDEAWSASNNGKSPLVVSATDEAGNVAQTFIDLSSLSEFHGRMTTPAAGGCGCVVAGGHRAGEEQNGERLAILSLLPIAGLLLRRRRSRTNA